MPLTRTVPWILLLCSFTMLAVWGFAHAHTDLWWDEISSLEGYALVGLRTVFTSYSEPNNHIVLNVLDHLLLRVLGIRDLYGAMDRVAVLRWTQWVAALGTMLYVIATARRAWGTLAGALAGTFLVTTLPFLNVSLQLRGYNLSLFFVAGLLYHSARLFGGRVGDSSGNAHGRGGSGRDGEERGSGEPIGHRAGKTERSGRGATIGQAGFIAVLTFALLYTVPSNVYFVLALSACALGAGMAGSISNVGNDPRFRVGRVAKSADGETSAGPRTGRGLPRSRAFWLLLGVGAGACLALLAYAPILGELFQNRFVSQRPEERAFILTRRLFPVLDHFLSYRYGLLLLALPGLFAALRDRRRDLQGSVHALPLLVLLLLPFFLSFLRNDDAYERTFVHLAPVFVLLLAGAVVWTARSIWPLRERARTWLGLVAGIYALLTATFGYVHVQERLERGFRELDRGEQNILANSYQARSFRPRESALWLSERISSSPGPVLLVHESDRVAWASYLRELDVPSYSLMGLSPPEPHEVGTGMTHAGHIQYSGQRGDGVAFLRAHLHLPELEEGDALTPLLQALHRYERYYVVTDFPAWLPELSNLLPPGWSWEMARETGGFGTVVVLFPQ